MIPKDDKHDLRHAGEKTQKTLQNTSLLALQLTHKIVKRLQASLQENKQLRQQLSLETQKSNQFEIRLDGKTAFKSVQDPKSTLIADNKLANTDVDYISQAVDLPLGEANDFNRNLSIKINDQEVFRLQDGVVQVNDIQQQQQHNQNPESPMVDSRAAIANDSVSQQPAAISADLSPTVEPVAAQLKALGIDPQPVRAAAEQHAATPVIVVVQQQQPPVSATAPNLAAAARDSGGKINPALDEVKSLLGKTRQSLTQVFNQLKQPFKTEASRRQDLHHLAIAATAQRLLDHYGQSQADGSRTLEGEAYRFRQLGNRLTISAQDGRGTLLQFGEGQLQGHLSRADRQQFRQLQQLLQDADAPARQSGKTTTELEVSD